MTTDILAVTAVMARDAARLETGLRKLGVLLQQAGGLTGAIMLDVDGSARIRQKGLPAKRSLVLALQNLVRSSVRDNTDTVIDSGTRDEILVLTPGQTRDSSMERAGCLLDTIRAHRFRSEFWDGDLHVTASLGVTLLDRALPPDIAFARARAALAVAKKDKNCTRFVDDESLPVPVATTQVDATDLDLAEAVTRGVRRAEEKYLPMWYWLARTEGIPTDALREASSVGSSHDPVFLLLVNEIRQESRLPGAKGAALVQRQHARTGSEQVRHVRLGAWTRSTLRRLSDELAVPPDLVAREALRLAAIDRELVAGAQL